MALVRSIALAAAISAPIFPAGPTVTTFSSRDYAGKPGAAVTVKSMGSRARVEGFGAVFFYDGQKWIADAEPSGEAANLAAFLGAFEPRGNARCDFAGRPVLLTEFPAGARTARIDYRYDDTGLLSANMVLSDGSGFQFRRTSSEPQPLSGADFEPARNIEAMLPPGAAQENSARRPADYEAVERLLAVDIPDGQQAAFERIGGVGRFRRVHK